LRRASSEQSSIAVVSDVELVIVDDGNEVAAVVAERLARAAREGGHVVLTGGTTPEQAYEDAAQRAPDWSEVELWWGDERCVPADHEHSNYGMAKRALLDRLERGPRAVHRIKGELGKERGAAEYERELGDTKLDLLLLGVGSDGHVASLFPNAPTLRQRKRVLPAEAGLEPFVDRVTLSLPTLRSAREILFLLAGEAKADAARRAFAAEPSPDTPASLVRARGGRTTAILDRAAAAMLPA
jgi:6-phosphogluconolactonase